MLTLKAAALIAALTISTAANAGLAQYSFKNVTYSDGAALSGYFIQDEATRAILHWGLEIDAPDTLFRFFPDYGYGDVSQAFVSHYEQAPTNFTVFQRSTYPHVETYFNFAFTGTPGTYQVSGAYRSTPSINSPSYPFGDYVQIQTGSAVHSLMNADQVRRFEEMCAQPFMVCIPALIPAPMPEPSSIVLIGLAAAGMYSVRRRKVA